MRYPVSQYRVAEASPESTASSHQAGHRLGTTAAREVFVKIPTHCDSCAGPLSIHCGAVQCTWLRCRNPRCIWENMDVERGLRVRIDGQVRPVSA